MKNHVKMFYDFHGYKKYDFILCMNCERAEAVDVHHLSRRGAGGNTSKDRIDNLVAVCRSCHWKAETDKEVNETLKDKLKIRIEKKVGWEGTAISDGE